MQIKSRSSRVVALLTGGIIAATAMMNPAPVQAADSKTYKAGAVVLGAAAAYMILKGKTVPGAIAGAGAYYAYKKSKKNDDRYGEVYPDDNYYSNNSGTNYPDYSNDNAPYYGNNDDQYPDYGYSLSPRSKNTRNSISRNGRVTLK